MAGHLPSPSNIPIVTSPSTRLLQPHRRVNRSVVVSRTSSTISSIQLTDGQHQGHMWKIRYSSSCLWMSIQHVFSPRTPSYAALLELDKKIRKFPIPEHLQPPIQSCETERSWSSTPSKAMQQYCVLCVKESSRFISPLSKYQNRPQRSL